MEERGQQNQEPESERFVGQLVLILAGVFVFIILSLPVVLGMIIFAILHALKRNWLHYVSLSVGLIVLLYEFLAGNILRYFGVISQLNFPYISHAIDVLLNHGKPIPVSTSSYVVMVSLALVCSFGFSVYAKYYWKARVSTKTGEARRRKAERTYIDFRKNRVKFLNKKQLEYRKQRTDKIFLGYTEYKERVELTERELNYHVLFLGGSGTGKTTAIAALAEASAIKKKPIIFIDGKGELKSMMEFKALFESYGLYVHMFTELSELSYNPIKHGTPTEVRDKLMSLFNFSTEGDGAYYSDISSRYLQLIAKLLDQAGIVKDIPMIKRLTNPKLLTSFFQEQATEQEIIHQVPQEIEVEVEVAADPKYEDIDDILLMMEGDQKPEIRLEKRTVMREEKRTVSVLSKGIQEIKEILEEEFPEELVVGCLTRLRMQLGELLESDLGHLFSETNNGIDLREIAKNGDAVIFSISGNRYADYIKKLGKMIILDVNSLVAYQQATGKKPVFAVYDELGAYCDRRVVDIVNKSRSAGLECILSTQTLADLDAIDPIMTEQILSNVNVIATGRVNSPVDAERIAKAFGTYHDQEVTSQIQKTNNITRYESDMGTVREVEKFKANPSQIKDLQQGEIFISRKMIEEGVGETYFRRVYVRNVLDLGGIT